MDWIEETKRVKEELAASDYWRKHHLSVKSIIDIEKDLSEISSINFTEDFKDVSVTEVLPEILKTWPNINTVYFNPAKQDCVPMDYVQQPVAQIKRQNMFLQGLKTITCVEENGYDYRLCIRDV